MDSLKKSARVAGLNEQSASFWFPAKTYGWGWGLPIKWQGWFVLVGYLALEYVGIQHFTTQKDSRARLIYVVVLTVVLVAIVVLKGERPVKWRWGRE